MFHNLPNHRQGTNVQTHEPVWSISHTNHNTYKFSLQLNIKRLCTPRYVKAALCILHVATRSWGSSKALVNIAVEDNIKKLIDNDHVRYRSSFYTGLNVTWLINRTAEWGRLDSSSCCKLVTSSGMLSFLSNISGQFYQWTSHEIPLRGLQED